YAVIEIFLLSCIGFHVFHSQSFRALLARAYVCTGTTSGTVVSGYYHGELVVSHTSHRQCLHAFRSVGSLISGQSDGTDNSMRADISTAVTLDTVFRIPYRDIYCDTTFLVCGRSGGSGAVHIILECGYGQRVS